MITPQQRNAWRGAYLRQLRKIAESTPNPWMDEIEWDNELLEDRLSQFVYRDYLRFLKTVAFVFDNHPLVIATLDGSIIKDEDACTVSSLFHHLMSLTSYGRYGVISGINCDEEAKQRMMSALELNNEELFSSITKGVDLTDICKSIGYVSSLSFALRYQIQMMEHQELSEEEESRAEEVVKSMGSRLFEPGGATIDEISNNQLTLAKKESSLKMDSLPEELEIIKDEYYCIVLQWIPFSIVVDAYFLPKEFSIVESILDKWRFTDINKDLMHLYSLVHQDYQYQRIVLP